MAQVKLVVLITSQIDEGYQVGEAWQKAGAPGVTFLEGFGLGRLQQATSTAEILPGMLSMFEILRENRETSLVVMSLIHDPTLIQSLLDTTTRILGDMLTPNAGIFFVLDVEQALGIRPYSPKSE